MQGSDGLTTAHRFRGFFGGRDPPRGTRDRTYRGYLVRENPWLQLWGRQNVCLGRAFSKIVLA
jgi:hypothetical protein